MATTRNLAITLVEQSQSQKEVTVNQALVELDAFINTGAKSMTIGTPPSSPATGDLYIVAASPTGAWAGQAGMLAYFNQVWNFVTPNEGMTLWVNDQNIVYSYNGSAWVSANAATHQQYFVQTTLSDAASITWDVSINQASMVTLAGNRTLANPTNMQAGARYSLIVKQDATGSRTLSYGSAYKWPGGSVPVLSTGAGAVDMLVFVSDGTTMYGTFQKGFA